MAIVALLLGCSGGGSSGSGGHGGSKGGASGSHGGAGGAGGHVAAGGTSGTAGQGGAMGGAAATAGAIGTGQGGGGAGGTSTGGSAGAGGVGGSASGGGGGSTGAGGTSAGGRAGGTAGVGGTSVGGRTGGTAGAVGTAGAGGNPEQPWMSQSRAPVDLAVLGDAPYGADQIADFPQLIADMSGATPPVEEIVHLGDIKDGSSPCDTSYFQLVLDGANGATRPFLFTPGDNEWTDCHRANDGGYDPLERLATIRAMFYPVPGLSLGVNHKQVLSQAFFTGTETFVENQLWLEAGTVFALVHVVGSNNSLLPWYTDDTTGTKTDDPARRTAEEAARAAAGVAWLDRAFAVAAQQAAAAVVIIMQADMWDVSPSDGFDSTVQKIASSALAFGKPVLLIEGDSHVFKTDNPFAAGDPLHGVTTPVPNITRVVVQGSTTAHLSEWVRLHVDPAATPPFSWTRVPNPRP